MSGSPKRRVSYVLSSPHSGSTLLGIVLSAQPDVVFGGELFEIPHPGWEASRSCSCGELVASCPFWSRVRAEYRPTIPFSTALPSFPARWGWRAFPRMLLKRSPASKEIRSYVADVVSLARAVADASGRGIVIDTSKDGTRALAYTLDPLRSFDVRFIHLMREGGAVVSSRMNREVRTSPDGRLRPAAAFRYTLLWVAANLAFALVFSIRREPYLRVRYEDLLTDPEGALHRIGEFLEVDLSHVIEQIRRDEVFPTGHILSGNRLRLGGGTRVRREDARQADPLSPLERRMFSWLAGWAARLLGYP